MTKEQMQNLFVVSELFANRGEVPSRIAMSQTGIYTPAYGDPREITLERFNEIVKNFDAKVQSTKVSVYYGHWGDRKAAGEIMSVEVDYDQDAGKNILYGDIEWTEAAQKAIKGKEYKYVSAEMVLNYSVIKDLESDTIKEYGCVLTGLALTNEPAVYDLPSIMYSGKPEFVAKFKKQCFNKSKGDKKMDELLKSLGVNSKEEALEKFSSLSKKIESLEASKETLELSRKLKEREGELSLIHI